jgi:hypothetical protein
MTINTTASTERQVWYLILHYGLPLAYAGETIDQHFRIVEKACRSVRITVALLDMTFQKHRQLSKRYVFRFPWYKRDDLQALRVAEAFECGFSIAGVPLIDPDHDGYFLPIPRALVTPGGSISFETLVDLEEKRDWKERTVRNPYSAIETISSTTTEPYETAWRLLPLLLKREDLFDAARFWKASQDDFFVFPGEVREVLEAADSPPETQRDQTRFETALHNAFKAVEAVVGDPPKSDRKFFARLQSAGLDPHEIVGYENKRELHHIIREMNRARDRKSAHGSTRNRTITLGEMFDFHSCAQYIVSCALETELGHPLHTH